MGLTDPELIDFSKKHSPDVLRKLNIYEAVQEALKRAAELADESLKKRRELQEQLAQLEQDISRLKAQRQDVKTALKSLRQSPSGWNEETLSERVDPETRKITTYFRELLEGDGYRIEYKRAKAIAKKDDSTLISLWPRRGSFKIGIDNAWVFGPERLRELETLGQVTPDNFVCKWSGKYLTKEDKTLGAEANGRFLVSATFEHVDTLDLAKQISASVLKMGDFVNRYWQWFDAEDVNNRDIWIRNPKKGS